MKALPERPHQLQLAGVARVRQPWIRADPHVQSDDRANPCQLHNGRGWVDRSLDPSHVRARQAYGSGDLGRGQTASDASVSEFGADGAQVVPSKAPSSVDCPFSWRHAPSLTVLAHLAVNAVCCIRRP